MTRRRKVLSFLSIPILCCGLSAPGQISIAQNETAVVSDDNLVTLLKQMHANLRANEKLAHQYVCDDSVRNVYFNKHGKRTRETSEKVDSVFANELLYHQIVERNGKPLSQKKQIFLQKHEDAISELGSGFDFIFDLSDRNPGDSVFSALPICCLAELFENHIVRHETINGRDNLVVESLPKASPDITSAKEATALDWKETTWIDAEYLMPTRFEVELVKDKRFLLTETKLQQNYFRLDGEATEAGHPAEPTWLENHAVGHFLWSSGSETFDDVSYNFKRFKTDARVLNDSVQVLDPQSPYKTP